MDYKATLYIYLSPWGLAVCRYTAVTCGHEVKPDKCFIFDHICRRDETLDYMHLYSAEIRKPHENFVHKSNEAHVYNWSFCLGLQMGRRSYSQKILPISSVRERYLWYLCRVILCNMLFSWFVAHPWNECLLLVGYFDIECIQLTQYWVFAPSSKSRSVGDNQIISESEIRETVYLG